MSVCMDLVLSLQDVTRNGNVTDLATRLLKFIPTNKIESADDTAHLMFWNMFRLHQTDHHF